MTLPQDPQEDLVMDLLAARRRLGEHCWTFRDQHEGTLRSLESKGLVFTMHGIVEGTVRAGLTEAGAQLYLSDTYVPPILKADGRPA